MRRNSPPVPGPGVLLPQSAPKITDPRASAYSRAAASRLPKSNEPRDVSSTPLPPLEMKSVDPNLTLAQQGALFKEQVHQASRGPGFPVPSSSPGPSGQRFPILPSDTLPPQASQDPAYQQGVGAVFAHNQPHLALKYGVMRNGTYVPPEHLQEQPQAGRLRSSTLEGLAKMAELNQGTTAPPAPPTPPVEESAKQESEEDKALNRSSVASKLDDFDWNTFREMMAQDVLNTPEQRKLIEARLQPMDIADLVTKEYVRQVIPINPGKFEVTFQSSYADEEIEIKRIALESSSAVGDVKEQHVMDRYYIMGVALGLHAVNNNPMPSHRNAEGRFDEQLFLKKLERVLRLPFHMVAALGIQHSWFQARVRGLFTVDAAKNG